MKQQRMKETFSREYKLFAEKVAMKIDKIEVKKNLLFRTKYPYQMSELFVSNTVLKPSISHLILKQEHNKTKHLK